MNDMHSHNYEYAPVYGNYEYANSKVFIFHCFYLQYFT